MGGLRMERCVLRIEGTGVRLAGRVSAKRVNAAHWAWYAEETTMASRLALVVEDDPSLQHAMAEHVERAKFQVLTALDFNAAIELEVPGSTSDRLRVRRFERGWVMQRRVAVQNEVARVGGAPRPLRRQAQ
jgi:hypothetical protein